MNLEAQRKLKDAQIKSKQDSLALVVKELLLYKPAPPKLEEKLIVAQDVSGPIKTVTIGKQVWMLENLNVATFKNGVVIPEVKDKDAWVNAGDNQQAAWCYYDNDPKMARNMVNYTIGMQLLMRMAYALKDGMFHRMLNGILW